MFYYRLCDSGAWIVQIGIIFLAIFLLAKPQAIQLEQSIQQQFNSATTNASQTVATNTSNTPR